MKIKFHNNDLTVRTLKIKDSTKLTLKTGIVVPTSLAMERMLNK